MHFQSSLGWKGAKQDKQTMKMTNAFQPSLGWKGTKQEPKTTFPLNFFSVAIHDFSAISLVRAKIFSTVSRKKKSNLHRGVKCKTTWLHVCGKTNDAKRHCYVKSHLRPRTYINLKFFRWML